MAALSEPPSGTSSRKWDGVWVWGFGFGFEGEKKTTKKLRSPLRAMSL